MKTGIVIQARKGSTRLPGKMVLPFYKGKNLLEILLEKIKSNYSHYPIILATTVNNEDDELEEIAQKKNIPVFRGSEQNVLDRFIKTGEKYKLDNIIRVCADNPFLDMPHIQTLINQIEKGQEDYVSFKNEEEIPVIKTHLGLFTEAVKLKSLKRTQKLTSNPLYLEHVTNFIYENEKKFDLNLLNLPPYFNNTQQIRLTLDTQEDFELEKKLYNQYSLLSTEDLIKHIKKQKDLLERMEKEISKNIK